VLPGRTTTIILAGLAVSPSRIVPSDMLIDWIWGPGCPPARLARSRAESPGRRLIGEDLVETAGCGYRLRRRRAAGPGAL
jgi:hypothetical protein